MEDYNTNFNFTKPAIIIPTVSGSISFISSMLIIYVILKSPKLFFSTPYHRIMFGMSIGDCIISLAIALTTIPMPKDVIYPFAQSSYGNIATCNAQAYAGIGGQSVAFWMSLVLYLYYGCSLVFHMKDVTFRKWIETPSIIALVLLLFSPLLYSHDIESLNPSPTIVWCTRRAYPDKCTKDTDPDCREEGGDFTALWVTVTLGIFAFLIIDMCLIVFSFYRAERKLKARKEEDNTATADRQEFTDDELMETRRDKRRITKEALMYIASFFAIWIFPVLYADLVESKDDFKDIPVLAALRLFFQPLQGFLNMLIFFYHKMEILKGKDENESLSIRERFKMVLLHPGKALEEKKIIFSNLPMLDISSASNEQIEIELPEDATPSQEKPDESLSPSKLNLFSDLGMTSLASSSRDINRNDTDKFQLSLSQGESLSSSREYEGAEYFHYNEISISRNRVAKGNFVNKENEDLSFRKMHRVEEEEEEEEIFSRRS